MFRNRTIALLALQLLWVTPAPAQDNPEPLTPEQIIQKFTAKESEFRQVWEQYTYTQRILFQVLNRRDEPSEQREMIVEVFFNSDGTRDSRVVSDRGGLSSISVTQEDLSDALNMQPFVLTSEEISHYKVKYKGKEQVDELSTYVFEVDPRDMEKGKRYFRGQVWVDDVDLQIVMSRGKIEPDLGNNKFPKFETIREQIDDQYWFPTWTLADDVLHFGGGFSRGGWGGQSNSVHINVLITYSDFQKYEVGTTIRYGDPTEAAPDPKVPEPKTPGPQ